METFLPFRNSETETSGKKRGKERGSREKASVFERQTRDRLSRAEVEFGRSGAEITSCTHRHRELPKVPNSHFIS